MDLQPIFSDSKKLVFFGFIGAIGCTVGALFGELILEESTTTDAATAISLLIDCSGSMAGEKLAEVKQAAIDFVKSQPLESTKVGVIAFHDSAEVEISITNNVREIEDAISQLYAGGGTNMTAGLNSSVNQFNRGATNTERDATNNYTLIFTDGMPNPNSVETSITAAKKLRLNATLLAIATDDAETWFLEKLTGDPNLVIRATAGSFGESFEQADEIITSGLLGEGTEIQGVATWTVLVTLGVSLALILGQNWYSKRPLINPVEFTTGALGGTAAGLIAGIAGQLLFLPFAETPGLEPIGRIFGWAILGALVGRGMAFYIPNLDSMKSFAGGAVAGALAAVGFLLASLIVENFVGRLLGAGILGSILGILIALVELACREAWLEVHQGPEMFKVNLGAQAVAIGSGRQCAIYAAGERTIVSSYNLVDGKVDRYDASSETKSQVKNNHEEAIGKLRVVVKTSNTATPSSNNTPAPSLPPAPPPRPSVRSKEPIQQHRPATKASGPRPSTVLTKKQADAPNGSIPPPPPPPPPPPARS